MRNWFDWLAKRVLERAFKNGAEVRAPLEISAEAQMADVWIQPAPDTAALRAPLGLLGRIVDRTCLLEPFHEAPDATQIRDCVLKLLAYDARQRRAHGAVRGGEVAAPLWILSAGAPRTALASLGFTPAPAWPSGVYALAPGWATSLVVINELPTTRDTLLLRLLGAGTVLSAAVAELRGLPQDSIEVQIALPVLRELRVAFEAEPAQTEEEQQFAMEVQKTYEEIMSEAQTEVVRWQLESRLGRALTEGERSTLMGYVTELGARQVSLGVLERDSDALLRWLQAPRTS